MKCEAFQSVDSIKQKPSAFVTSSGMLRLPPSDRRTSGWPDALLLEMPLAFLLSRGRK